MAASAETQCLFPYLSVDGAEAAMAFYQAAFGAEDQGVTLRDGNGKVVHAEMTIGKTTIFLAEAAAARVWRLPGAAWAYACALGLWCRRCR